MVLLLEFLFWFLSEDRGWGEARGFVSPAFLEGGQVKMEHYTSYLQAFLTGRK